MNIIDINKVKTDLVPAPPFIIKVELKKVGIKMMIHLL